MVSVLLAVRDESILSSDILEHASKVYLHVKIRFNTFFRFANLFIKVIAVSSDIFSCKTDGMKISGTKFHSQFELYKNEGFWQLSAHPLFR